MTVAERTRAAVRAEPFVYEALRAGVLNYTAAARYLDVGDESAVSAALRRYEEQLESRERGGSARVTMKSGVGDGPPSDALLSVGDEVFVPGEGSRTAVLATGDVGAGTLRRVLGRCETAAVAVHAAAAVAGTLVVVVSRSDGPNALRAVEDALGA